MSLQNLKQSIIKYRILRNLHIAQFERNEWIKDRRRRIKNRAMLAGLIGIAALSAGKAFAGDVNCLSRIIYAETGGHSIEHAIAIGQAAITKAEDDDTNICQLRGVKRKQPPREMVEYYRVLAKHLLDKPKQTVSRGADHWNTGKKPIYPGEIKRQFNNQVLYVMTAKGEK